MRKDIKDTKNIKMPSQKNIAEFIGGVLSPFERIIFIIYLTAFLFFFVEDCII